MLALAVALATKIAAQRRRGVVPVVLGKAGDGLVARLEPLAAVALFLWFAAVALHGTGWAPGLFEPRLFRSAAIEVAGTFVTLAAFGLLLTALRQMGRSWRIGIDPGSHEALVTEGVFALSRNPIYFAIDLLALGAFLVSGSLFFLVSGLLIAADIHIQILREERFLTTTFGDRYARYRARVRRYFGRRGKSPEPTPGQGDRTGAALPRP